MTYIRIAGALALSALTAMTIVTLSLLHHDRRLRLHAAMRFGPPTIA